MSPSVVSQGLLPAKEGVLSRPGPDEKGTVVVFGGLLWRNRKEIIMRFLGLIRMQMMRPLRKHTESSQRNTILI